jgi:hypothetical protein
VNRTALEVARRLGAECWEGHPPEVRSPRLRIALHDDARGIRITGTIDGEPINRLTNTLIARDVDALVVLLRTRLRSRR